VTDREIMQQALEALQAVRDTPASADEIQRAWIVSDLLQRRLAQPEQEPVVYENLATELFVIAQTSPADDGFSDTIERIKLWLREHFSTPPQRTWVGSGDLEDSNAYLTPPRPKQELVIDCPRCGHCCPQRKPLTDEEIERACVPLGAAMLSFTEVARAIEAKLKEKNT
jgi:hypothetical protein